MPHKRTEPHTDWLSSLPPLPIDGMLPELVTAIERHGALVLEAPPAAGKTTRFPRALLEAGLDADGEILVLEPRRLATRMAARRVASELGEEVGGRVGYSMRFESVGGPQTRLRFMTEGVLLRRLSQSTDLRGVAAVILDEFHERHLETDVALASLIRLRQTTRPDLRLAVMSATLDAEPIASHLGCPRLRSEGKSHPVDISYLPSTDSRALEARVEDALGQVVMDGLDGHVLVFLPGVGEIAATERACQSIASKRGLRVHRLHGSLSREEQDAVLAPTAQPKLVLATNVAETSVTIEGVTVVIDSALVKEAGFSPWSGLPNLRTTWASKASADQRAGRAGRTRPGRCLRLVTRREFEGFAPFTEPELQRADLCGLLLALKGVGFDDPGGLPWLQPPPQPAIDGAERLLQRLGALDESGRVTETGRDMLVYPTHPRLARVLCEAKRAGVLNEGALLAAILEHPDPRPGRRWTGERAGRETDPADHPSDPILIAEQLSGRSVEPGQRKRILRAARLYGSKDRPSVPGGPTAVNALCRALLAGYPDRVARRLSKDSDELHLCGGGRAVLARESSVRNAEYLVALEAREDARRAGRTYVSQASAIEPDWLLDLPGGSVTASRAVRWDADRERVEVVERLFYDDLVLDEQPRPAEQCPEATELLAQEALKAGLERFFGSEELARLLGRMAFLKSVEPDLEVIERETAEQVLRDACRGRASFRDLDKAKLISLLQYGSSPETQRALDALAPEEIRLSSGLRLKVEYPLDGQPFAKARLQACYGTKETPRVGGGRVAVQLHLLAPNQRPAQITDDLARFWGGTYELVRKELKGRYPKHYWPDDPANASPVQLKRQAEREA